LAVDRNQPEYLAWLRAVEVTQKPKLDADEQRVLSEMQ